MMATKRVEVFKFPRTKHLFNAGGTGVSRDDLLMDPGEEDAFYTPVRRSGKQNKGKPTSQTLVSIEEKVDGANLGISLGEDLQIRVQNRSHFVNSQTHRQFSTLDSWLSEHSGEIYELLDSGNNILFGEWLYAKHSIHYTKLPGYFMAFDLYSLKEGKFYSWRERNRRLGDTTIPVVRQITETTLSGRDGVSSISTLQDKHWRQEHLCFHSLTRTSYAYP